MTMIKPRTTVTIIRLEESDQGTFGALLIDGQVFCVTLRPCENENQGIFQAYRRSNINALNIIHVHTVIHLRLWMYREGVGFYFIRGTMFIIRRGVSFWADIGTG